MSRRKSIQIGRQGSAYETVRIAGPKKFFNKRIKKVSWGKTRYAYVSISARWYGDLVEATKSARRKKGLSQMSLAGLLRTSQPEVSRFEHGHSNPTVEFIDRLISVLDLELKITNKKLKK